MLQNLNIIKPKLPVVPVVCASVVGAAVVGAAVVGASVGVVQVTTSGQQLRNNWQFALQEQVGGLAIQVPILQHSVMLAAAQEPKA